MRFTAEELNTVLDYINAHAANGVLFLEGYPAAGKEIGIRAGRVAAIFYFLCGEGRILQDGKLVLTLDDTPYSEDVSV